MAQSSMRSTATHTSASPIHCLPAGQSPSKARHRQTAAPTCIADYARAENLVTRVDPAPYERKFNSIPVRIIIDRKGKVKHVHVISAFPDQARNITDALLQWRFKENATEVETGIVFGSPRQRPTSSSPSSLAARGESGNQ